MRLVDAGLSVAAAAELMGIQTALVQRLLDDEADRSALATLRRDHVENAPLRRLFRARQRQDPSLTVSELARRVGSSPIQVERWLGLRQTAAKTDRRGRCYPPRTLTEINVETAGRFARALGYAPCEIDGC